MGTSAYNIIPKTLLKIFQNKFKDKFSKTLLNIRKIVFAFLITVICSENFFIKFLFIMKQKKNLKISFFALKLCFGELESQVFAIFLEKIKLIYLFHMIVGYRGRDNKIVCILYETNLRHLFIENFILNELDRQYNFRE